MTPRPLEFSDFFGLAIRVCRRHAWSLAQTAAIVLVPLQLLIVAAETATVNNPRLLTGRYSVTHGSPPTINGHRLLVLLEFVGATWLIGSVVGILFTAACFKAVADGYLGRRPDPRRSLAFALRRWGVLVPLTVLQNLGMVAGFALFVVPGIWLYAAWSVAVPVLLIEDTGAVRALGRSVQLVRGYWWRTLGVLLVAGLIAGTVVIVPSLVLGLVLAHTKSVFTAAALRGVIAVSVGIITVPFVAAVVTALYLDLRLRREGLDIAELAARIGALPATADEQVPSLYPPPPAVPPFWEQPPPGVPPGMPPPAVPPPPPLPGGWEPPQPPA